MAQYLRIAILRLEGVSIGKNCFISWGAKLDSCAGKIIIGDRCEITYGCVILSHDSSFKKVHNTCQGVGTIRLGNDVFIGVNSVVLSNVTIGDKSVIGAGSVVTKNIPPNVVAAGNPATVIRELSKNRDEQNTRI